MNIKIPIFVLLLSLSSSFYAFAQENDDLKNIDKQLGTCIDENPTTMGSINCIDKATAQWDKVLNKYYGLLKSKLSAEGKQSLLDAQREWIKMRDKEFALIDQIYNVETGGGTMYIPMALSAKMEIVKARALALIDFYDTLTAGY